MDESLDEIAGKLRASEQDAKVFLEAFAGKMEEIAPTMTRINRSRHVLFGPKVIDSVVVTVDQDQYQLALTQKQLSAAHVRVVGGIAIKTTALPFEQWITQMVQALGENSRLSEGVYSALLELI